MEAKSTASETPLVAVISPSKEVPADLRAFLQKLTGLASASRGSKSELELHCFDGFASFAQFLAKGYIPHVLLVDHPDFVPPKATPKQMSSVFLELRRNDPNIAIFAFGTSVPDGNSLMHWMDAGLTALLQRGESGGHLDEALEELLKRRLSAQYRRALRIPHAHKLNMSIPNLQQALVAEILNIGVGGMFIQTKPREMKVGDIVEFTFILDGQESTQNDEAVRPDVLSRMDTPSAGGLGAGERQINGTGKIAWIRNEAGAGLPQGIGLQFLDLESNGQILVDDFVKKTGTHAFIPKA